MKYLVLANNSGGLYRFRKELMEHLIEDGHIVYAVTPFDTSFDVMKLLGFILFDAEMNRWGSNLLLELSLFISYLMIL